jgi:hypothetical protein
MTPFGNPYAAIPTEVLKTMLEQLRTQQTALNAMQAEYDERLSTAHVAAELPFAPAFTPALVTSSLGGSWAINREYFASTITAQWIAAKYGTGQVISKPYVGSGGPFTCDVMELHIKLSDGREVNAGVLAAYYVRNSPSLAHQLIVDLLAKKDE